MAGIRKRNRLTGIISLVSAAGIYGFFGVLTRAVGFDLPLFYAGVTRHLIGCAILAAFVTYLHVWKPINPRDRGIIVMRSIAGIVGFLGSYISFYYLPIGFAYFIFYGFVAIGGYIIGSLMFKEQITRIKFFSLLLALVGLAVMYITSISQGGNVLYVVCAAASGMGTAAWNVLSKKISGNYHPTLLNFYDFLVVLCIYTLLSFIMRENWVVPSLSSVWAYNLLFVVLFISTGQLMIVGFAHIDAQIASVIMLSEVLFGILLALLFFKEVPTFMTVVGGVLVLVAILYPSIHKETLDKKKRVV